jgi:hypothetical protein
VTLSSNSELKFDTETEELIAALQVPRDQRRKAEARVRRERDKDFDRIKADAEAEAVSVADSGSIENVARFFETYLSPDTIEVRFLAGGGDDPRLSFAGSLLGRDEYIQREREALYSRYGSLLTGWTSVLQIARIPDEEAGQRARERDFSSIDLADEDVINRSKVLQSAVHLTEMLEARGIAEGPLWPTISVIPLAIYRMVPRTEAF